MLKYYSVKLSSQLVFPKNIKSLKTTPISLTMLYNFVSVYNNFLFNILS